MDLSKMCTKERMRYEVAMEVKENFITKLNQDIIIENFEEILYMISRAEYKRGKADGDSETAKNDLLYFAGKETHDALIKNTEEQTIKQIIKYLEERGYKVTNEI